MDVLFPTATQPKPDVTLYYCTKTTYESFDLMGDAAWALFPRIVSVTFENCLLVTQGDATASCVMTLNYGEYDVWQVKEVLKAVECTEPLTVIIKCRDDKATITFTGTNRDMSYGFPPATQYSEFLFIQLSIPLQSLVFEGGNPAKSREAVRRHITVSLRGTKTFDIQSDGYKLRYDDQQALRAGTAEQEDRLCNYLEMLSFFSCFSTWLGGSLFLLSESKSWPLG